MVQPETFQEPSKIQIIKTSNTKSPNLSDYQVISFSEPSLGQADRYAVLIQV